MCSCRIITILVRGCLHCVCPLCVWQMIVTLLQPGGVVGPRPWASTAWVWTPALWLPSTGAYQPRFPHLSNGCNNNVHLRTLVNGKGKCKISRPVSGTGEAFSKFGHRHYYWWWCRTFRHRKLLWAVFKKLILFFFFFFFRFWNQNRCQQEASTLIF